MIDYYRSVAKLQEEAVNKQKKTKLLPREDKQSTYIEAERPLASEFERYPRRQDTSETTPVPLDLERGNPKTIHKQY